MQAAVDTLSPGVDANTAAAAELRLRLEAELRPTRTPFPPWPDNQVLVEMVQRSGYSALRKIALMYAAREKMIRMAAQDPLRQGWEWECWTRADRFLPMPPNLPRAKNSGDPLLRSNIRVLAILGGNRASKSEYAIKRAVQSLLNFPKTLLIFLSQKEETSRMNQQGYVWRYLPQELKALNRKTDPARAFYIKYEKATGFTGGKIVLPNGSEAVFLFYTQNPTDYEGIQIGCPDTPGVIGWAADESLPLEWLNLLITRSSTYDACGLWTFTALRGMTPALKETLGEGKVLESRPADALNDRQNVPGIPVGHMPTVQQGARANIAVVYFHTIENPLGGYTRVLSDCEGKPAIFKERKLYGYVRDVRGRVLGNFGATNIVPDEAIPREGTLYFHTDPAAARNWFMLWALVDPEERIWIYDEWPSVEELGEWALPTERNPDESGGRGWDGDTGPAQEPVGFGVAQYKNLMLRREAAAGRAMPFGSKAGTPERREEESRSGLVFRRTVDRRAGPSPLPEATGEVTCIWQELGEEQRDNKTGELIAPALAFELAGGPGLEDDGLEMVKDSLYFDREKPLDPLRNFPRLFVSAKCQNLIWAMQNYTGRDGQKGACKDPIDCLRDLFTSGLEYQTPAMYGSKGGGSY